MYLMLPWLLFVDMVLATSSPMSSPGVFINPSAEATQNPSWVIGSHQMLSWKTSLNNYTIALWNQNSDGNGYSRGPALLESYNGSDTWLNWTVQTYSLSASSVFYLLLQPGALNNNGNSTVPTAQSVASNTFNVTSTIPSTESDKKDHKLGLILSLSLTIPFVLICIALIIYFVRSRRRRALETPPHYQYPYHVGFRNRPNRFFAASTSPRTFTFPDQDDSPRERGRQGSKTSSNGIYFPPPPTTPKSPLSFASSLKTLRGLRGNTMSPGQINTPNQNFSPTFPSSYPRTTGGYNGPSQLSPTYYPLQRVPPLTPTDAGNPHIKQLQEAQEELAIERQRQGVRMGYPPERSPYDEPRVGPENGDQKWVIKPYVPPEILTATKKRYLEEQAGAKTVRSKFDYDEPGELW
ncbi:hypothetical protein SBOR_8403 [Sclerotinia borealis F-4128]|uniref:Uncharacterized protein n=1 Tax=Sclerotinia borealis (strain F-4128) TaxID=1432307 RepID=W9C5P4_SCLBF|nr:hypothetical protein SBOR_8403 [Sclerotinia borealis F-4128]